MTRDMVSLDSAASRLGMVGMTRALRGGRRARFAAIAAAPMIDQSWLLLETLVKLMASRDRHLATHAASATLRIAEDLRRSDLDLNEGLPQTLDLEARRLSSLVSRPSVSLDIRLKALLALSYLVPMTSVPAGSLLSLFDDRNPRIREAAAELFAHRRSPRAVARLVKVVAGDLDLAVARAAAVALCAAVSPRRSSRSVEFEVLKSSPRALKRLRLISESLDARDDQLIDVARCLLRARDRGALKHLRSRSRRLRRLVRRIR